MQRHYEDLGVLAEMALESFEEENEVAVQLSDLRHRSGAHSYMLVADE